MQRMDIKRIHCPLLLSPAIIFISGCNLHQEGLDRTWHLDSQDLAKHKSNLLSSARSRLFWKTPPKSVRIEFTKRIWAQKCTKETNFVSQYMIQQKLELSDPLKLDRCSWIFVACRHQATNPSHLPSCFHQPASAFADWNLSPLHPFIFPRHAISNPAHAAGCSGLKNNAMQNGGCRLVFFKQLKAVLNKSVFTFT